MAHAPVRDACTSFGPNFLTSLEALAAALRAGSTISVCSPGMDYA